MKLSERDLVAELCKAEAYADALNLDANFIRLGRCDFNLFNAEVLA